jgi:hypothetical protein
MSKLTVYAGATPHLLDSIWRKLSYSLHLLIGLGFVFSQPTKHGGWSAAKGQVWALVVAKGHPFTDACLRF